MGNQEYTDAWAENGPGDAPAETPVEQPMSPATNAVQAAAATARDADAKEFSDAFHADTPPEPPKPAPTFKEAFANARADGLKVFDWNGKKYTTDLAKPKAPGIAPVKAAVVDQTNNRPAKPAEPAVGPADQMKNAKFTGKGSK